MLLRVKQNFAFLLEITQLVNGGCNLQAAGWVAGCRFIQAAGHNKFDRMLKVPEVCW